MNLSRFILTCFGLVSICVEVFAQAPKWAYGTGGSVGDDYARVCKVAPNGNILVAGYFSGTADFNFGPSTYNLTSNGSKDCFIACYSSLGSLQWAFKIGGSDIDMIYDLHVDNQNNVLVAGSFRGQNVDFDPSANSVLLSEVGNTIGSTAPYAGEIFFAKYSPSGSYIWAMATGSSSVYEYGTSITTDTAGYIYAAGRFHNTIDVDPSSGIYNLNSSLGQTCFLAKYTPSGQLIRAFNFGGSTDNFIRGLKTDDSGNVYITGYFQGTNVDFDPSATGSLLLTANGNDLYIAKYDSLFNVKFAYRMGGSGLDEALDLELDANNNIYIAGYVAGSVDFDPTSSIALITAPGMGSEFFIAKYTTNGQYVWARIMGGPGNDYGFELDLKNNALYCTGRFESSVDFDPSTTAQTLTSAGAGDIFVSKYTLNGNYLCAFRLGSTSEDAAEGITVDDSAYVYVAGTFSGTNVDFNPSPSAVLNLSSNGQNDLFVSKFAWICETSPLAIINLESITGQTLGSTNRIDWKTAAEERGDLFEVERSADGREFVYLASTLAKGEPSIYTFWDSTPLEGTNYYRIRLVSPNGQTSYSKTITLTVQSDDIVMTANPNPTSGMLNVTVVGAQDDEAILSVCDAVGKTIRIADIKGQKYSFDISELTPGIYFLKYSDRLHHKSLKIIKR